jgi:hypothetical protein
MLVEDVTACDFATVIAEAADTGKAAASTANSAMVFICKIILP